MDWRLLDKFEGLKHIHLHIQTFTMAVDDLYPLRELQSFVRISSLERLANVHLKSFRISVSNAGPHCKGRLKDRVSEWIRLQEDEVLPRSLLTLSDGMEKSRRGSGGRKTGQRLSLWKSPAATEVALMWMEHGGQRICKHDQVEGIR